MAIEEPIASEKLVVYPIDDSEPTVVEQLTGIEDPAAHIVDDFDNIRNVDPGTWPSEIS